MKILSLLVITVIFAVRILQLTYKNRELGQAIQARVKDIVQIEDSIEVLDAENQRLRGLVDMGLLVRCRELEDDVVRLRLAAKAAEKVIDKQDEEYMAITSDLNKMKSFLGSVEVYPKLSRGTTQ